MLSRIIRLVFSPAETEIRDFHFVLERQQNVARRDVSVYDVMVVQVYDAKCRMFRPLQSTKTVDKPQTKKQTNKTPTKQT